MFSRPVPKSYVTALEGHAASLELFIQKLAGADNAQRDELLANYAGKLERDSDLVTPAKGKLESNADPELALARARTGQLKKLRTGNAAQFFGGTSLFHIHADGDLPEPTASTETHITPDPVLLDASVPQLDLDSISFGIFPYSPHHEICQQLMANFFGAYESVLHPFSCIYTNHAAVSIEGHHNPITLPISYRIISPSRSMERPPTFREAKLIYNRNFNTHISCVCIANSSFVTMI